MKKILLVLSVLGMSIAQTSGAAETTFQSRNALSHTITNISDSASYGASRNIYSINSGAYKSSNDEISRAIDNLSAHAKQIEYEIASQAASDRLNYIKKRAEQGSAEYQVKLGLIYYEGKGVRQDIVLARKMFQKAANQGDVKGQGMLGALYEYGLGGLRQNKATAKELYGKTCDKGSQAGCDQYRRLNEQGY